MMSHQRLAPLPGEPSDRYSELRVISSRTWIDLTVCDDCGVLVGDRPAHDNHHDELAKQAALLNDLGTRTYGAGWADGTPH